MAISRNGFVLALLTTMTGLGVAHAHDIRPGLYAIEYRLEMPHLERYGIATHVERCTDGTRLPIISTRSTFETCDLQDRVSDRNQLRYSLICEGTSTARAFAEYKPAPGGFIGRIFVKMGGKNMTMTEVQSGTWLRECPSSVAE